MQFTDEQKAAAQQLDPSQEALLREVNLNEELIMAFRVQEIHDRGLFVALDTSEEGLRKTAEQAFGVDPSKGFVHKRELANIVKARQTAKVQNETKVRVDAVVRAHGEPVTMLHPDWLALTHDDVQEAVRSALAGMMTLSRLSRTLNFSRKGSPKVACERRLLLTLSVWKNRQIRKRKSPSQLANLDCISTEP